MPSPRLLSSASKRMVAQFPSTKNKSRTVFGWFLERLNATLTPEVDAQIPTDCVKPRTDREFWPTPRNSSNKESKLSVLKRTKGKYLYFQFPVRWGRFYLRTPPMARGVATTPEGLNAHHFVEEKENWHHPDHLTAKDELQWRIERPLRFIPERGFLGVPLPWGFSPPQH